MPAILINRKWVIEVKPTLAKWLIKIKNKCHIYKDSIEYRHFPKNLSVFLRSNFFPPFYFIRITFLLPSYLILPFERARSTVFLTWASNCQWSLHVFTLPIDIRLTKLAIQYVTWHIKVFTLGKFSSLTASTCLNCFGLWGAMMRWWCSPHTEISLFLLKNIILVK